jgi:hypothetical protein
MKATTNVTQSPRSTHTQQDGQAAQRQQATFATSESAAGQGAGSDENQALLSQRQIDKGDVGGTETSASPTGAGAKSAITSGEVTIDDLKSWKSQTLADVGGSGTSEEPRASSGGTPSKEQRGTTGTTETVPAGTDSTNKPKANNSPTLEEEEEKSDDSPNSPYQTPTKEDNQQMPATPNEKSEQEPVDSSENRTKGFQLLANKLLEFEKELQIKETNKTALKESMQNQTKIIEKLLNNIKKKEAAVKKKTEEVKALNEKTKAFQAKLEKQDAQSEEQKANLEKQKVQLEEQEAKLKEKKAQLQKQEDQSEKQKVEFQTLTKQIQAITQEKSTFDTRMNENEKKIATMIEIAAQSLKQNQSQSLDDNNLTPGTRKLVKNVTMMKALVEGQFSSDSDSDSDSDNKESIV